jgi:DNA-nicking Smr family endonuclease
MSRRRHLTEEERALWSGFARSIKPLDHAQEPSALAATAISAGGETAPVAAKPATTKSAAAKSAAAKSAAAKPVARDNLPRAEKSPPLAPLGRRLRRRVARGREPIDDRIDLHGHTQTKAHAALLRFLRGAQADGARVVLVVTGKGTGRGDRDAATERGVLKRQVPMWLAQAEFRPFVLGFEDAHIGHGGEGALYVRLRRGR